MAENRELVNLFVEGVRKTFATPALLPEYFSKSVVAEQNGVKHDYDSWIAWLQAAKLRMPNASIRFRKLTAGPRSVGVFQYVYVADLGLWLDSICQIEYGAVGTEDERKVVRYFEVVEMGPKDRDPDAEEFQSIV